MIRRGRCWLWGGAWPWVVRGAKLAVVAVVTLHLGLFLTAGGGGREGVGQDKAVSPPEEDANWLMMATGVVRGRRNLSVLATEGVGEGVPWKPPHPVGGRRPQLKNVPKILLVTYYRGGSTLLGKLFDLYPHPFNPKGFYWFEPLVGVYQQFYKRTRKEKTALCNGYSVEGEKPDAEILDHRQRALDVLRDILTCQVTSLPVEEVLLHSFVTGSTLSRRIAMWYRECLVQKKDLPKAARLETCIPRLQGSCTSAIFTAIKTIRVSLRLASQLMQSIPDLRIVYSYRDPRGILASRKHLEPYYYTDEASFAVRSRELCGQMSQDLAEADSLRASLGESGRERLTVLRYEDLALNPLDTARDIYRGIGLELTPGVREWLIKSTTTSDHEYNPTTVHRNATEVVQKWRHSLSEAYQRIASEACHDVLQRLRYDQQVAKNAALNS